MAWEIPCFVVGQLVANADYSAESYLYTPVKVLAATGSGITDPSAVAPVASTGDPAIGIMQNNPALGEAAVVMSHGISKARVKGSVSVGNKLVARPTGGMQVSAAGNDYLAIALEPGNDGDIITVLLVLGGKVPA